ncbi:MAG TPA: type I secretion system permease/ATPase [Geminicoccaceae bacterium]|nr:type I secretion system permease/ATPase [Geminicoccaceae bacterium]
MVQPARPPDDRDRRAPVLMPGPDGPAAPTALHPVGALRTEGPEHGDAGGWAIAAKTGADDPLLASLVTLSELLERPTSPDRLVAGLPLEDGRLTPALALRAAARAGLAARLVQRPLERISDLTLPCILLLQGRGACVLVARSGARAVVALPESGGRSELPFAELAARYAGHALFARPELRRDSQAEQARQRPRGGWFWGTLAQAWPIYGEVLLAAVLINLFALAAPLFIMNVYDRVVPNHAIETLWVLAVGVLTVFLFDFLLRNLRGYFVDSAGRMADVKLASLIFEQVLGLRMAARPASAGAFANNLREFESLRDFLTSATLVALVDLPFVLLFIAVVWLIGGPVALVPAAAVPLVIGVGLLLQLPLNAVIRRSFQDAAQKHGVLVESLGGLETIKSVGAEGRTQRRWEQHVGATASSAMRARLLASFGVNFSALAQNAVTVGVVIFGVYRIAGGDMTVGALVACTIITGRAMAPLGQVAGILTRYHQARASFEALDQVMALPNERPAEARFLHRPQVRGAIAFQDVTFRYPGEKQAALEQVSFAIAAGERVGLIGRIGSGKSTVEKLVLGLYEPEQGAVLIDGTDLRQIDPADVRRHIGCVLQDVVLFRGRLRDNIALGAPFADDAAVLRAAQVAGVADFVARHPRGFDLDVGERGERLSGGQRQAVAVARALLLDPPILVLDEPTSAMDNDAENRLKQRLGEILHGKTLLLVTHRASLLSLVERLIVLDGGRLLADGPKDEVLAALADGRIRARR